MKVSKEIVKIQNRLKKLTYKQAKYIMISTEYYQYQNIWYVFPLFQEEGSEYITYIANPFPSTESNIVEGKGRSLTGGGPKRPKSEAQINAEKRKREMAQRSKQEKRMRGR